MTQINRPQSFGFLDVSVIDRDPDFLALMIGILEELGVNKLRCGSAVKYADHVVRKPKTDIIFMEFTRRYTSAWEYIRMTPWRQAVVVGMIEQNDTRESLSAIRSGAERVMAKSQAGIIVEPTLLHLLESEEAKRFNVVPFPRAAST